ncbi:MAG: cation acetate symporter [Planctomycetota bacterium]|nr:MAG: cation acetate symporter [Planctomycetota bacterium]REJ88843.1 MAG: cation acetate symporter [Planctomycetota bacterium]REK29453.1 MAG: cation acetate symporter [Planctomycetota bacterium]REK31818.1 MAG: cation acetate symporter [Planctomycetota bacterium]
MLYEFNLNAVFVFGLIVAVTLWISFYLGRQAKSASGFFAAGGGIHWFVNGVAFAGDYLSAASFLGICGMIAFYGYDGFLYSIGYLAGWIVALFVVAEPLKRLGKYTFADALDAQFDSRGIKLMAAIATLVVSVFYLIPQMVGAGALVTPLFGLPHWVGVSMVGAIVVLIVVSAGMVSTTYVQFLKGSLLVVFSAVLTLMILARGFTVDDDPSSIEPQVVTVEADGDRLVNGVPQGRGTGETDLRPVGSVSKLPGGAKETGPVGPLEFFRVLQDSEVVLWKSETETNPDGSTVTTYSPQPTPGSEVLRPGNHPAFKGIRSDKFLDKLNFLSLMLALFCGTASLPHILIRYYTVKDQASARKSTIVGIGSIGFFYVLTLYLGLGAMTSGAMDVTNSNMAAPLLARSFNEWLFAIISAIAFTTVLGTVSGLIVASSGAVVHDLMSNFLKIEMHDSNKVRVAKIASVVVGVIAIVLGILFEKMNVNYLVGWAFSIAASANLPSLVMLLFWKGTTKQGITAAILVGMVSSLGWILLSADTFAKVYGYSAEDAAAAAVVPFSQPGIVTIPLGFLTLIVVSLLTKSRAPQAA